MEQEPLSDTKLSHGEKHSRLDYDHYSVCENCQLDREDLLNKIAEEQ